MGGPCGDGRGGARTESSPPTLFSLFIEILEFEFQTTCGCGVGTCDGAMRR